MKKITTLFLIAVFFLLLGSFSLSAAGASPFALDKKARSYTIFRDRSPEWKKAVLQKVKFITVLPEGTYTIQKTNINPRFIQSALNRKAGIIAGVAAKSSPSNVLYARKKGLTVIIGPVKNMDEAVAALILEPDQILLEGLTPEMIRKELLSDAHKGQVPPAYVDNYSRIGKRAPGTSIRVLSFNILAQVFGALMPPVKERLPLVREVIMKAAPDFAGLQEVDVEWYEQLRGKIAPYAFAGKEEYQKEWKYRYSNNMCAIIYHTGKYRPLDGDLWTFTNNDKFIRNLHWVLLEDMKSKKRYIVTNTHWNLTVPRRKRDAARMAEFIKTLQTKYPGVPIFSTGDFNSTVDKEEFKILLAKSPLRDSMSIAPRKENEAWGSYHPPVYGEANPGRKHIDHIAFAGDFEVLESRLFMAPILFRTSDHFPLVTDFKAKK